MKAVDGALIGALLKKQRTESMYRYRRGRIDVMGLILGLVLAGTIVALFVVFFGKFTGVFLQVKGLFGTEGSESRPAQHADLRLYELMTLLYGVIFLFMTLSAVTQVNREIFESDGARLYAAMPIGATSLYIAKAVTIYATQALISSVVVFTVNITAALQVHAELLLGWEYWFVTVITCFILPLLTITVGSVLALPYRALKNFLRDKFIVTFVLVTVLAGLCFWLYSIVLAGVKELLLGDDLKYFFDERKMTVLVAIVHGLYPVKWLVDLLLTRLGVGSSAVVAGLGLAGVVVAGAALSLVLLRALLLRSLQARNAGSKSYLRRGGRLERGKLGFFALAKKDFLLIFRTPAYMFSYFSVAVIMPLMVYFCMSVGGSLLESLVDIRINTELALFLTLLFGALTNIFCATNISRDGEMFYSVKAYPVSYRAVFFSKVFLCMLVTVLSQLANAVVLIATGYLGIGSGIFVFCVGVLFGFADVCIATRYDFNHAHFSTEEDGEIKETGGVVSAIIVLGLLTAFGAGGAVVITRLLTALGGHSLPWLTYAIGLAAGAVFAALGALYLFARLGKRYYQFEGGEI